jgi:Ankyrin repeats (many copies)
MYAAQGGHTEVSRFLLSQGIEINLANNEGNTALHFASKGNQREVILQLLINGAEHTKENGKGEKPGTESTEMKLFFSLIVPENAAFKALNEDQKKQLRNIFDDIVKDQKAITLDRSKEFNLFMEDVTPEAAEKDAQDFIGACALCNKTTVRKYIYVYFKVNYDEWIFAFSKLYAVNQNEYTTFIEDYDAAVTNKGQFRNR